jgi:hypothetical protein
MSTRLTIASLADYVNTLDAQFKQSPLLVFLRTIGEEPDEFVSRRFDEAMQVVSDGLLELGKQPLSFAKLNGYIVHHLTPEDKWRQTVAYVNDLNDGGVESIVKDIIELNGWK